MERKITRREFIKGVLSVSGLAAGGAALSACGGPTTEQLTDAQVAAQRTLIADSWTPTPGSDDLQATIAAQRNDLATAKAPKPIELNTQVPTVAETPEAPATGVPSETPTGEQPRYTNVHAIEDGDCESLSSGEAKVWKDYVRAEKDVNIYAHDGRGEQGSEICRGETEWGWRVPWDGFENYEAAQEYALGEADRVWGAGDANPLRPGLDSVDNVRVFNGAELVKEYK